ncbi:long-chain-fatty-acid-CoA ligase protein [Alicycliphilus sp. B1]|nr:long-chain-fatty-acid-CoA ligase protein [Alicycliphilus sp. B1]
MTDRPWLAAYPQGVPADIDPTQYQSLVQLMEQAFRDYADRTAYSFMGKDISFGETDALSRRLAAYLQSLGLARGDRVALMMPNVPQYPIAVAAVLRAGFVVVNVNPLYTPRELEHQLKDSGAKAIVIIENFAATLQACIAHTAVKHVVLCAMGDRLGLKGLLVNYVVRNVKKLVPPYQLPGAVRFNDALAKGASAAFSQPELAPDDIALLQYTGGTTGVSKGAVLLHRNVIANVLQSEAWNAPATSKIPAGEQPTAVCALPLYHIFAFTVNMMLSMRTGGKTILIPNPRDLAAVLKELSRHRFHSFPAVNTLFNGLANHPQFNTVDWSHLKVSVGGGMAVQAAVAKLWLEKTGCPICEGYGLSETSPSVSCNPVTAKEFSGTIGVPIPSTYMRILDDDGHDISATGQPGEIAIKGPQVMAGYWQRPDETAKVMAEDGYFKTGDIRHYGRARLLQGGGPQEGHGAGQRLQRLPQRGGGRGGTDARRAGVRRGWRARRQDRRGCQARHREEGSGADRGAGARVLQGQSHGLQAAQGGRVPHGAAQDPRGQDLAPRAARQEVAQPPTAAEPG